MAEVAQKVAAMTVKQLGIEKYGHLTERALRRRERLDVDLDRFCQSLTRRHIPL